jgi:predicted alpha/beta-hydrolase family hydrolase
LTVPLGSAITRQTTASVYLADGPTEAAFLLGHGAGAGQRSAFIVGLARALSARGIDVVTFDFPYVAAGRRVPDRGPVLEDCYRRVIEAVRNRVESAQRFLFIGGKSMGGRIATQVAAADPLLAVAGLILLGYPLHPPGRPADLRTAHLPEVGRPMLFVQGSRDPFGTPAELRQTLEQLSAATLWIVEGGDHSLKISRGKRAAQSAADAVVQQSVLDWIASVTRAGGR